MTRFDGPDTQEAPPVGSMTPSNPASDRNEARPQLFDPLAEEIGRFASAWVNPEDRIAAIDHLYRLLRLAREFPFPATERAIGAGIDVERLRAAMEKIDRQPIVDNLGNLVGWHMPDVEALAAEYARLTPQPGEDQP